ncbi:hypothetical protein H2199_000609 [Coniosporium tulheliwenetii]|uniref:Uncharacterized protein n=1 Tax=Coniosporium tulheliwenetii TaxID=3383036 RepID=A0ACC2ZME3_9PEZI|nr:hypothetical protein H2199_000609 [Cladosporium sp. JES 115]
MTRYCQGMLLYTPDGYVSLQLSTPGQAVFRLEGAGEGSGRRREGANAMPANGVPVNGVPVNGVPGNPVPANAVLANGVPGQPLPGQGVPGGRGGEARRMKMVLQLRHEMRLADLPQSRGSFQIQRWRFEKDGKVLVLTGEPTEVRVAGAPNGKRDGTVSTKMDSDWRIPEMRWRKMGSNAVDMPPRPQSVFERPPSIVPQMAPIPRVHRMSQMPQMHNGSTGNASVPTNSLEPQSMPAAHQTSTMPNSISQAGEPAVAGAKDTKPLAPFEPIWPDTKQG